MTSYCEFFVTSIFIITLNRTQFITDELIVATFMCKQSIQMFLIIELQIYLLSQSNYKMVILSNCQLFHCKQIFYNIYSKAIAAQFRARFLPKHIRRKSGPKRVTHEPYQWT